MLKLDTKLNTIQMYAPISSTTMIKWRIHEDVEEAIRNAKIHEITMLLGDFKDKIGNRKDEDIMVLTISKKVRHSNTIL